MRAGSSSASRAAPRAPTSPRRARRPSAGQKRRSTKPQKLSRSHQVVVASSGLVSIIGGKWTTGRLMAEDTVNHAATVGGLTTRSSPTKTLRLHGWHEVGGGKPELWLNMAPTPGSWLPCAELAIHCCIPVCPAALVRCIGRSSRKWRARWKMCWLFRLRAPVLDAQAAIEMAPQVAHIMASEQGRDEGLLKNSKF